jgi:hypothetical protein
MRATLVVTSSLYVVLATVATRPAMAQPGAPAGAAVKDPQVVKAAQFAIAAQQQAMQGDRQAAKLTLVKIVSAQKQVVSGMSYQLTLQVKLGTKVKTAEAKVWEQAWEKPPYKLVSWKFTDERDEPALKSEDAKEVDAPHKAQPAKGGKTVKFTICDEPYFVNNTYEPNAAESFAMLTGLEQFDNVFRVGMTMTSKRPTINAQTFQSQTILAVIKRGPMCHYTVQSVAAKGDGLEVRYQVQTDPPGSATYAVPLILAVPKGEYASVAFVENGKEVKVVKRDQ